MKTHLYFFGIFLYYIIHQNDCLVFDTSNLDSSVKVNISQTAIIKFKYRFESNDDRTITPKITCGYEDNGLKILITKAATFTVTAGNNVPANLRSRISTYTESGDDEVFGLSVSRVQDTDPRNFRCSAAFSVNVGNNKEIETAESSVVVLEVYHPPKFIQCFNNINENTRYDIDDPLPIQCFVTGHPTPRLKCELIGWNDLIISTSGGFQSANVSTSFTTLYRTVSGVTTIGSLLVCTADGSDSGIFNVTKSVQFSHQPFPVQNFSQYNPDNAEDSTIYLRWSPLPQNETGGPIRGYEVTYFIQGQSLTSEAKVTVTSSPESDGYIHYKLKANSTLQYTFTVKGLVSGASRPAIPGFTVPSARLTNVQVMSRPVTDESSGSDTGAIVGGVVGGIVLIAIIVILCVYCSRKSQKNHHYPTSYVEDAVDYPRNDNKNLYSSVDKKPPRKVSETDSTSGYPDVVTSNNGDVQMRNKAGSYSYEPSSKAYV